jgi:hypothetical protein
VNPLIQAFKNPDQPINGEPIQIGFTNARNIRCLNAGQLSRLCAGKFAFPQNTNNLSRQVSFHQFGIGVGDTRVPKGIITTFDTFDQLDFIVHRSRSFSLLMRSITLQATL